jgi:predicted membrane metal-binding protein
MRLSELITGEDNVTLDPHFALGVLAVLVGLGLEVVAVMCGRQFDLQAYGVGVGVLLAGMGAGKKLAASLLGFGFLKGLQHQQALDDRAALAQVQLARRVEQRQAATTSIVEAAHVLTQAKARVIYQTISNEVVRYAKDPGAVVRLDAGWVREHNAAAVGVPAVSDAAGFVDGAAGGVTAVDALATVTGNYASCNDTRRQLIDLQSWLKQQALNNQ